MLRILSLGTIVDSDAFVVDIRGKRHLVPLGFRCERAAFFAGENEKQRGNTPTIAIMQEGEAVEDWSGRVHFRFDVREATGDAGQPLFVLERSDDPEKKRYTAVGRIGRVWNEAMQELQRDFAETTEESIVTPSALDGSVLAGLRACGLSYSEVIAAVSALPGAEAVLARAPPPPAPKATPKSARASPQPSQQSVVELSQGGDGGAAAKPKARKPRKKATGDGAVVVVDDGAEAKEPPKKRARKSAAAAAAAAKEADAATCPECGLAGVPFCAATGKPHAAAAAPAPCPECGLTSAFCPVSGQPHAQAPQRPGRARGEVRLPSAKRTATTRKRRLSADAGVAEVTVVGGTQESDGGAAKKAKKPRGKRTKAADAAAQQTTLDAALAAKTDEPTLADMALAAPPPPPKEKPYEYPALRPQLTPGERSRAGALLQKVWQQQQQQDGQREEAALPTHVSALRLPAVQYRAPARAVAAKRARGDGEEEPTAATDDDAATENDEDGDGVGAAKRAGGRASPAAARPTVMIHPLEVRDAEFTPAGRRYTRFRLQYTSERTQLDLLRNANTEKKAAAPSAVKKDEAAGGDGAGAEPDAPLAQADLTKVEEEEGTEAVEGAVDASA